MTMKYNKITLHIPHSSDKFPSEVDRLKWEDLCTLRNDMDKWTDWGTDRMFDSYTEGVERVIFAFSRFYCDVERLKDDPMENIGQGIAYSRFNDNHRHTTDDDKQEIMCIYHQHIDKLKSKLTEGCLLIDCHSFPEELSDVDICIGLNDDWSRPDDETIKMIVSHFKESEMKVEINVPYSNSIAPKIDGIKYSSVMIEVNKRLYMTDGKVDYRKLEDMKDLMRNLYEKLLK